MHCGESGNVPPEKNAKLKIGKVKKCLIVAQPKSLT
ncbi:hypothetical protein SAMN05216419_10548 [Nitrosomonas cryotolerans]|nr:hypothetical protein SAMN05216419_10548 [Nitrosomonas cryotolerans]